MRSEFFAVGVVYFLLVANFYNESSGFTDAHNFRYAFWKITPIAFLASFAFLHGGGMKEEDRNVAALALLFGGLGDFILGMSHNGIVLGAIAFGIGHLFYLSMIVRHATRLHTQLLIAMLLWGAVVAHLCLRPLLADHFFAVLIMFAYSLLLSTCVIVSVSQHLNGSDGQTPEGLFFRAIGFAIFYLSDTILIFAHTGRQVWHHELCILGTYYTAQYLILYGNVLSNTVSIVESRKRKIK